jgi:hypothetical protein
MTQPALLSADRWTVVARAGQPGKWRSWAWIEGLSDTVIHAAVVRGDIITMHRHSDRVELVARLRCRHWQRIERALARRPLRRGR